ncbi:MAG: hypothetical protein Q8888_02325 [Vigna little leaf phytoplasma]|nr:hypothetical protein [Vigna little leaf phytoplasma]
MWLILQSGLTKLNQGLNAISQHYLCYQNEWLNFVLLIIIFLFLPHLLCLLDFLVQCLYYMGLFLFYFGQYCRFLSRRVYRWLCVYGIAVISCGCGLVGFYLCCWWLK